MVIFADNHKKNSIFRQNFMPADARYLCGSWASSCR